MKKTKIILTITLLIIILLPILASADEVMTTEQYQDLKQQINSEGIKTRTELTLYVDRKVAETMTAIETQVKPYIDENFKIFDNSMRILAIKFQVQLAVTLFCVIILSNATWYWIRRKLDSKKEKIPKTIKKDTLLADKYGLVSEEYLEKIRKEDESVIKPTPFHDVDKTSVEPPAMTTIERLLEKKRQEELEKQQAIERKKIADEEKKKNSWLQKIKDQREANKKFKLEKKLEEQEKKKKIEEEKKLKLEQEKYQKTLAEKAKMMEEIRELEEKIKNSRILPPNKP